MGQVAGKNILVNAVCPGVFPSKMTAYAYRTAGEDKLISNQPTGRLGSPEDFGGLIIFLSSRASAHITGAAIPIDGGALLNVTRKEALELAAQRAPSSKL